MSVKIGSLFWSAQADTTLKMTGVLAAGATGNATLTIEFPSIIGHHKLKATRTGGTASKRASVLIEGLTANNDKKWTSALSEIHPSPNGQQTVDLNLLLPGVETLELDKKEKLKTTWTLDDALAAGEEIILTLDHLFIVRDIGRGARIRA